MAAAATTGSPEATNNVLFIGGNGDDTIRLGGGNVIAFNRGDGRDVISRGTAVARPFAGRRDPPSRSGVPPLRRQPAAGNGQRRIHHLRQLVPGAQQPGVYQAPVRDRRHDGHRQRKERQGRDFRLQEAGGCLRLARKKNPGLSRWALTNGLATFHLDSSQQRKALGGDLAYAYGTAGSLAGIGVGAAQDVLTSAAVWQASQALHPGSRTQEGLVKLA